MLACAFPLLHNYGFAMLSHVLVVAATRYGGTKARSAGRAVWGPQLEWKGRGLRVQEASTAGFQDSESHPFRRARSHSLAGGVQGWNARAEWLTFSSAVVSIRLMACFAGFGGAGRVHSMGLSHRDGCIASYFDSSGHYHSGAAPSKAKRPCVMHR